MPDPIRFLLDVHISTSIRLFLESQGHDVHTVVGELGGRAPDPLIVQHALQLTAVVVTRNVDHFELEAARALEPGPIERRRWGLLGLTCDDAHEERRLRFLHDIIVEEYAKGQSRYPNTLLLHMVIRERQYLIHY